MIEHFLDKMASLTEILANNVGHPPAGWLPDYLRALAKVEEKAYKEREAVEWRNFLDRHMEAEITRSRPVCSCQKCQVRKELAFRTQRPPCEARALRRIAATLCRPAP